MRTLARSVATISVMIVSVLCLWGQSADFKAGKYMEIQTMILRTLENQYVDSVSTDQLLESGIKAMLAGLDPYTVMIPEENEDDLELMTTGTYGGVGALIQKRPSQGVLIAEPYENSAAVKFGLQPGDTIIAIDGKSVLELDASSCSNKMRGRPGTALDLKVIKGRTNDTVDIKLIRNRIHVNDVVYYGMIDDTTGYINIGGFTLNGSKDVKKALLDLKKQGAGRLVIDLRNNGGGLMSEAIDIVSLFVPAGTRVVYSKGKNPMSNNEYKTQNKPVDLNIPLLVLVNSGSASSSEIVAGALQDLDRATIAGTRTYGKGLVQTIRPVGYNTNLKLTTAKYYIPSGRCVQAIDYSHRNEDGSVGAIPDSLKKAFRTAGGRTVYDGGGIDPDIKVKSEFYSRPVVALIYSNIISDYSIEYYKKHTDLTSPSEITLSDEDYEEFVNYAASREFDCRTESQIIMEELTAMLKTEKLMDNIEGIGEYVDSLSHKIALSKEEFLKASKDIVKPLVEDEIAVKYFFRRGAVQSSLRNDIQLHKALKIWDSSIPVAKSNYSETGDLDRTE